MKTKLGIDIHNTYEIKVIDSITGKCKQIGIAKNTVVPQYWHSGYGPSYFMFSKDTTLDDLTQLTSPMYNTGRLSEIIKSSYVDDYTVCLVSQAIFPATSAYVGDYTCIGTWGTYSGQMYPGGVSDFKNYGFSKALIKDAEGNQITIHKTDLDQIVVTLYAYWSISSGDETLIIPPAQNNALIQQCKQSYYYWLPYVYSYQLCCTPMVAAYAEQTTEPGRDYNRLYRDKTKYTYEDEYVYFKSGKRDYDARTITKDTTRYNRQKDMQPTVYNALGLSRDKPQYDKPINFGYIMFPNSNIFPNMRLQDMNLCTGDGATKKYDLPVPWFVENTEQLKIGDTLLSRGTDYTVENFNNYPQIQETNPWVWSKKTGLSSKSDSSTSSSYYNSSRFFSAESRINKDNVWAISQDLILEAPDNTYGYPTKVNFVRLAHLIICKNTSRNYAYMAGLKFVISYSQDGSTWTELTTLQIPMNYTSLAAYKQSTYATFVLEYEFDTVDAKYWKFHVDTSEVQYPEYFTEGAYLIQCSGSVHSFGVTSWLGYKGKGIEFTNPPANGTEVTFNAEVDRPYKDKDYVIDFGCTVSY